MRFFVLSLIPSAAPLLSDALEDGPWGKVTLISVLVTAILAYQKRWIVPGALYDDVRRQNDELRQANEQLRRLVHEATGTAAKALEAEPPKRNPAEGG